VHESIATAAEVRSLNAYPAAQLQAAAAAAAAYPGRPDDYEEGEKDLFGDDFAFNLY
jgi:hypothetical protein